MYSLDTFIQAYLIRRIEPSQGGQSTADNLKKYRKMGPNCKSAEEYTCEQVTITDKIYITILNLPYISFIKYIKVDTMCSVTKRKYIHENKRIFVEKIWH